MKHLKELKLNETYEYGLDKEAFDELTSEIIELCKKFEIRLKSNQIGDCLMDIEHVIYTSTYGIDNIPDISHDEWKKRTKRYISSKLKK